MPMAPCAGDEKDQSSAARKLSISRAQSASHSPEGARCVIFPAFEDISVVFGVAVGDSVALAALVKLLDRVGTGGVEQPEPRSGAADIGDNQGFCHQIGQTVYGIDARCRVQATRGGLDRKAAGKDAESPEERLLVLA